MTGSGDCDISVLLRDGLALVTVTGDLDLIAIRDLERTLEDVAATGPRNIHLELSRVPFLATSGIGALVRAARRTRHLGIHLAIVVSEPIRQTLDVFGAADVLPLRTAASSSAVGARDTVRGTGVADITVPDLATAT